MVRFRLGVIVVFCCAIVFCPTANAQIKKPTAFSRFIGDTIFASAEMGVSVYDPASKKYLYDYQGSKYFVPASNVKIATCYAAMSTLKHILPGIRYYENDTAVYLIPTGDPTLLHRDFPIQPVIRFLQLLHKKVYITDLNWKDKELGRGWSWDDYNDDYMAERNALPVYGNTIRWVQQKIKSSEKGDEESMSVYSDPEVNWKLQFEADPADSGFHVRREKKSNVFFVTEGKEDAASQDVPFVVNGIQSALELLKDTTGKKIALFDHIRLKDPSEKVIWSQPLDSVLKPMMHRSDNFFAEQLLLMVSAEKLGFMSDEAAVDTLLRTALMTLPQQPVWVDGSGMSRYNLFTPHIFIEILNRMHNEFGMDRIQAIFPTGNQGTLKGYYTSDNGNIYAKTGSMTGVIALSGFYYTSKKKLLLFSVLLNNYTGSPAKARRRIEKFIQTLY